MQRALSLARSAAECGEVPVGAVLVDIETGEIIGEGANRPIAANDPTAHAEIVAIRQAAAARGNYRLTGTHLFVTLEPCAMCAGAISMARITRLTFAAADKKGGAVLSGPRFFESPSCHWSPDIEQDIAHAEDAARLLKQFFASRRR
ncbi:MAG: nucleoside deaminase [Pseudomonadota bacterium]